MTPQAWAFLACFSVRYNTANYVHRSVHGYTDLYTAEKGDWIAQVPTAKTIIEAVPACQSFNPVQDTTHDRIRGVEREVGALKRSVRALIKQKGK